MLFDVKESSTFMYLIKMYRVTSMSTTDLGIVYNGEKDLLITMKALMDLKIQRGKRGIWVPYVSAAMKDV